MSSLAQALPTHWLRVCDDIALSCGHHTMLKRPHCPSKKLAALLMRGEVFGPQLL